MTPGVRLAIIGSVRFQHPRAFEWAEQIIRIELAARRPEVVISGGADGIDQLAAEVARSMGVEVIEHLPHYRRWAPDGFRARNVLIVRDCSQLLRIACHAAKTYGSGWTADQAELLDRPVTRVLL